jgi:type II secretory pathway component PulC
MTSATFFNWLRETLQRLFMKSPTFFKIWQIISTITMVLAGVPYILTALGIHLPEPFSTMSNKIVTFCAATALFMSSLTVKTQPVAQTEEGKAVTVLPTNKLPFTQNTEAQEVKDAMPPPPVANVPEPEDIPKN